MSDPTSENDTLMLSGDEKKKKGHRTRSHSSGVDDADLMGSILRRKRVSCKSSHELNFCLYAFYW